MIAAQDTFITPWLNDAYFIVRDLGFPIAVALALLWFIYSAAVAIWERFSPLIVDWMKAAKAREESRAKEHREQTQIMGNLAKETLRIQQSNSTLISRSIQLQEMTYTLMSRMTGVSERTVQATEKAAKVAAVALETSKVGKDEKV